MTSHAYQGFDILADFDLPAAIVILLERAAKIERIELLDMLHIIDDNKPVDSDTLVSVVIFILMYFHYGANHQCVESFPAAIRIVQTSTSKTRILIKHVFTDERTCFQALTDYTFKSKIDNNYDLISVLEEFIKINSGTH